MDFRVQPVTWVRLETEDLMVTLEPLVHWDSQELLDSRDSSDPLEIQEIRDLLEPKDCLGV